VKKVQPKKNETSEVKVLEAKGLKEAASIDLDNDSIKAMAQLVNIEKNEPTQMKPEEVDEIKALG
jgi:hypothetical protein